MTGYSREIFFPKNDLNVPNDQRHRTSSQRVKKINVRCTRCLRALKVPQLTETAYKLVNTLKKAQTNIITRANISKLFCLSNTFAFLHLIGKGFQSHLQIKGLELENILFYINRVKETGNFIRISIN